ncbi:MAG: alpha-glucuronidase, partial [Sphingobium yanoikuyae]|nr:alpha-glucuronidase [Sphingobium yanoikuyae]
MLTRLFSWSIALASIAVAPTAMAEDGYDLWLRYPRAEGTALSTLSSHATSIAMTARGETAKKAGEELIRGLGAMTGRAPALTATPQAGSIWLATPSTDPTLASQSVKLDGLGDEGYLIRTVTVNGNPVTLIAANQEIGLLYG